MPRQFKWMSESQKTKDLHHRGRAPSVAHFKEWSGFTKTKVTTYSTTDLWWDIENNVMWSFDKSFMSRLNDHLEASFDFMNENKPKEPSM